MLTEGLVAGGGSDRLDAGVGNRLGDEPLNDGRVVDVASVGGVSVLRRDGVLAALDHLDEVNRGPSVRQNHRRGVTFTEAEHLASSEIRRGDEPVNDPINGQTGHERLHDEVRDADLVCSGSDVGVVDSQKTFSVLEHTGESICDQDPLVLGDERGELVDEVTSVDPDITLVGDTHEELA